MPKIRVGVLRGGPSNEHEVSLKTGENVLQYLPKDKYEGIDIVLAKDGQCYFNNAPLPFQKVSQVSDVVFNALHGYFGEDGKVQQILEKFDMPYTGSGVLASSLAMNKVLSRDVFKRSGFKIPKAIIIKEEEPMEEIAVKIFKSMNPFWVIKPASAGSSVGVSVVRNFHGLIPAMEHAFSYDSTIIAEEYIEGREVTCGVLDGFRDEDIYALPVVEIVPPKEHGFFDYLVKYDGSTQEICPAHFDNQIKREVENIARLAHQVLGCRGYSRTDMIVSKGGVYLLELNTLPGLTSESLLPKSANAVGLEFPQLLDHIIGLALNKR